MNSKQQKELVQYFCECTNNQINVIDQIMEFRKENPLNIQTRANLAMQIIMFDEPIQAAYDLIYDLIGLETQNVKALIHFACSRFDKFYILPLEKQCNLLIEMANNYQIPDIAVRLFFNQPYHQCMRQTMKITNQHILYLCQSHLYYETQSPQVEELVELFKFTRHFNFQASIQPSDNIKYFIILELNSFKEFNKESLNKFSRKNTLNFIQRQAYGAIDQNLLQSISVLIYLYTWAEGNLKELQSIMIVKYNMLILQLLYKWDDQLDLSFAQPNFEEDPCGLLAYMIQVVVELLKQNQQKVAYKTLAIIGLLHFSEINNDIALQNAINSLLKNVDDRRILIFFEELFLNRSLNVELYHKFAVFNRSEIKMDVSYLPRKQAIHNIVTSMMIKYDYEFLSNNIDRLFVLICVVCKNQQRGACNFLELVYILQYNYDNSFLKRKLAEYFNQEHNDLPNTLLLIYQTIEQELSSDQSLTFEYISVVAKMLHLIIQINQNPQNCESFMQYFSKSMIIINNLKKKLPLEIEIFGRRSSNPQIASLIGMKNPNKKKALLLNITLIERFFKINSLDCRQLQMLKLLILSETQDVPDYLLLQLSKNESEYNSLRRFYPQPKQIKELKSYCKIERGKKFKQEIAIKSRSSFKNLEQFLKHAQKLLSLQKQIPTINKIQIFQQLLPYLEVAMFYFKEKPKNVDELFKNADIQLHKYDYKDYTHFYLGNGDLCSPALFLNCRVDSITCYLKISYQMIKFMNRLGFYKGITMAVENITLFSQRVLAITTLINVYSQIPWFDALPYQQITDGVCNVVQCLNKKQRNTKVSESTRQSLYKQRRSTVTNLKDSFNKLTSNFDQDNILNGKFKKVFFRFTLEYLSLQNCQHPYLYEKLSIQGYQKIDLKRLNCQVMFQLFKCTNPLFYDCFVNDSCRHEYLEDKDIINQTIPTLILELCEMPINQNSCNYGYQYLQLVQNQLVKSIQNNLQQSKLYVYLYMRLREYLCVWTPQIDYKIRCNCSKIQNFDTSTFEFDMIANLATFQMNQKRIQQLLDISVFKCTNLDKNIPLTSIYDLKIDRDIVVINLFEYNGQKTILISKYCFQTKQCLNRHINSAQKCLQFKDALLYYLSLIQENIDSIDENHQAERQWWQKRYFYEQELLKKQTNIQNALSDFMDFIYETNNPLLILSPQLQPLPWDHFRNKVFSRVLSLGHIYDLTKQKIDPKQGLFYVLNPGKDLNKTEQKLLPILKSYKLNGLTRVKPNDYQIVECLQNKEYYLYIGHGGGQQYISETRVLNKLKELNGRPYLLGCSSASMINLKRFKGNNVLSQEIYLEHVDLHGIAVSYLLKGCPSLFGALWPITDKDADKYAQNLIAQYGENKIMNPEEVIIQTKPKCSMKVLNGTAFVHYGIHDL